MTLPINESLWNRSGGQQEDHLLTGNGSENGTSRVEGLDLQAISVGIVLAAFILFAIVGNIMVILSVACNRQLQTVTNYFIINLAIADLLLSTTVLPFSATLEVLDFWAFGRIFCDIWAAVDVLCCTASIMSLCIISIDRYVGVKYSLKYPTIMTEKRAVVILIMLWVTSMVISIGPLLGWKEPPPADDSQCNITQEPGYALFSSLGSFYLPLLVILFMYFKVYIVARRTTKSLEAGVKRERNKSMEVVLRIHCRSSVMGESTSSTRSKGHTFRSSLSVRLIKFSREKKAAKTLAIVVGVFILCWLPFFIVLPLGSFFPSLRPSDAVFKVIFWLGYFNSCVNPIIYPCSSKEFKRAFIRLLRCRCRRRRRPLWRVYDQQWRTSMNSSRRCSDAEQPTDFSSLNSSFIFNPGDHGIATRRKSMEFGNGWKFISPFRSSSSQLKEKVNSLSNKIRNGSTKSNMSAAYKSEVESISMAVSNDFTELEYQMYDLTDCCGLRETDI